MGYIQPHRKKITDMYEYKGRKARRQIDQSHNPSKRVTLTDRLGNGYTEILNKLGLGPEYRGPANEDLRSKVSDDAPPHGIPRPTGAGKIQVWTE